MKKIIKLTESDLINLIKNIISEKSSNNVSQNTLLYELNFQYELHKSRLNLFRSIVEKNNYLNKIKITYNNYFAEDETILLEYHNKFSNNIILESTNSVNSNLKSYFKFLNLSFLYHIGSINESQYKNYIILNEQLGNFLSSVGSGIVSGAKAIGNAAVSGVNKIKSTLTSAYNYVKNKGVAWIMDGIRSALDSGVGTAVQTFLSFTGVGNIGVAVVWGLMTIYDFFMWISKGGSIINFVFSVFSAMSTGVLAPLLKSVKSTFGGLKLFSDIIPKLLNSSVGNTFKTWVPGIIKGGSYLMGIIKKGLDFAKKYLNIKFLDGVFSNVKKYVDDIILILTKSPSKIAKTVTKTLFKAVSLVPKIDKYLLTAAGKKAALKLKNNIILTIKKEISSKIKDKTTEEGFSYIDKTYGKSYSDFFRIADKSIS